MSDSFFSRSLDYFHNEYSVIVEPIPEYGGLIIHYINLQNEIMVMGFNAQGNCHGNNNP